MQPGVERAGEPKGQEIIVRRFFADKYHLVHLHADVYTISYVPFRANLLDTVIIAAAAIMISYLATLYPSAAASKLQPVEALRYE